MVILVVLACDSSRTRPGPPSITIDPPQGSTVFSPDTLDFAVMAQDPDGLDSVTITVLDTTRSYDADFNTEKTVLVSVLVPSGLPVGSLIKIYAKATDLTGQTTLDTAAITVIKRTP